MLLSEQMFFDYKYLTRFEMFYRIRQYSFQQTLKKMYSFAFCFHLPPTPTPACAPSLPPPRPGSSAPPRQPLFSLVVFFWGVPGTPRDSASWLTGDKGRGFTDTLGNRSSSCSIGLCPGGGGSSNSATRREGKPHHWEPQLAEDRGMTLIPLVLPPFSLSLSPGDTYIPIVLSVIVSVSVVFIISAVEAIVVSPVSIIEITVTLRKEKEKGFRFIGFQHRDPLLSPVLHETHLSLIL